MIERVERSARMGNLPQMPAPFIGREKEIQAIAERLADPVCRLLTLVGPGGIGKTRLAVEVAAATGPYYPDGAWLVELDALRDPDLVPQAVASALGLREQPERSLLESLGAYLQPRKLMLVLDNCEHLLDACAQLAQALLVTCPDLCILSTSREPLHVAGEVVWPVPPLSLPDLEKLSAPDDLLGYEAVRLFVDRAERVFRAFSVTQQNAYVIARICARLDGLPLAIELAASWVKTLSVAQMNDRLDDRFRLLTGGGRAAPARQQTLESTLDWSYDLLSEQERMLFRRLAVFPGSFDLEAVEAITSGEGLEQVDILELLSHLVDKSLVVVAREEGQVRRYRLLETVRQYAGQRLLAPNEASILAERHLDWYLALAEESETQLWGTAEVATLRRLELEQENFRAALQWSVANARSEEGLCLVAALGGYWYIQARLQEGRHWFEQVLALEQPTPTLARARALEAAGALTLLQGDRGQATAFIKEGLDLARDYDSPELAAWFLLSLGLVNLLGGVYTRAGECFSQSMSLFRETGNEAGVASVLLQQGTLACHEGDYGRADMLLEVAVPLLRELGDAVGMARALHERGVVARRLGNPERARALHKEALRLAWDRGAKFDVAQIIEGLAGVAYVQSQPRRAACLFGAAKGLRQAIGAEVPTGSSLARHTEDVSSLRETLGEPSFQAAWNEGRALTLEQAVDFALADANGLEAESAEDQAAPGTRSLTPLQEAKKRYGGLTRRERQVAALVARGKSNTAIAEDLVVTVRTVEAHVTHILGKLGFSSRAQIAAWAVDRGLAPTPKTLDERMREEDSPNTA